MSHFKCGFRYSRIARPSHQQYIIKLQNADTARQTRGTGSKSLIIPARMIGTEQAIVTRIVKIMLSTNVIAASNLDMMSFFKWLDKEVQPVIRCRALILSENRQKNGALRL